MNKKKRFNQICRDIKNIKIQGARNVALAGLEAYKLFPSEKTKKILLKLRPTEPFLINLLKKADKLTEEMKEDLEFARRTEEAYKKIESGKGIRMDFDDFIKEMKKW